MCAEAGIVMVDHEALRSGEGCGGFANSVRGHLIIRFNIIITSIIITVILIINIMTFMFSVIGMNYHYHYYHQ